MVDENLRIHRVGNAQFIRGIVEDIHRIVKGYSQNRQRVSTELPKGIRGIVKGYLRICRRASAQSELSTHLWNHIKL